MDGWLPAYQEGRQPAIHNCMWCGSSQRRVPAACPPASHPQLARCRLPSRAERAPSPGCPQIELVREPSDQLGRMGVPEEHLLGHAYHTYQLVSPDGTVSFEFQHNVCGRSIYAEGTVDAALFLHQQRQQGAQQKVYNMVDVLKAGAMR